MKLSDYVSGVCCIIPPHKLNYYQTFSDFDYIPINENELLVLGGSYQDIPQSDIGFITRKPEQKVRTIRLQDNIYAVFPSNPTYSEDSYQTRTYTSPLELIFPTQQELLEASTICGELGVSHSISNTENKIILNSYIDLENYEVYMKKASNQTLINNSYKRNGEEFYF